MTIPTHVASYNAIPRDAELNDHSRDRGGMSAPVRQAAEEVRDLGNGITSVTYVDYLTPHSPEV